MARVGCRCGNGCPREASASGPGMGKRKDNVTEIHGCLRGVRRSAKSFRCIISFSPNCTVRSGCYYYSHDTYQKKKTLKYRQEGSKWVGAQLAALHGRPCRTNHTLFRVPSATFVLQASLSSRTFSHPGDEGDRILI